MELRHELWPLDIEILKRLPDDTAMIGGVHYVGRRVRDIAGQVNAAAKEQEGVTEDVVTVPQVNSRIRVMKMNKLCVDRPATGSRVWQRTARGIELLRELGHLPQSEVGNHD